MPSDMETTFTTPPRQAESIDTRMAIRRHDPDQERGRKKRDQGRELLHFDTNDDASVEIASLRTFLKNFLASMSIHDKMNEKAAPAEETAEEEPREIAEPPPEQPRARAGDAARAANAYAHAAMEKQSNTTMDKGTAEALGLSANEVRTVHALLRDLDILSGKGITHLHIENSDNILHGLLEAVEKAKNTPA